MPDTDISFWPAEDVVSGALALAYEEAVSDMEAGDAPERMMSLSAFVRAGWDVLEPGVEYRDGWHIHAMCEHLEAIASGRIKRLLITVPPGHMKSLTVSVFFPAWMWTWKPTWRGIFASYDSTLAIRDSVKTRQLVESEWYQETFKPRWRLSTDQNVKSWFENTRKGFRLSLSVGGKATGFRGDGVFVDDPMNAEDRFSSERRRKVIRWWDTAMSSRLSNQETGARVIMMQRLHQEDLAGHVIQKGDYDNLSLASEFEPEHAASTSIGWKDPRTTPGELLFPAMFPASVIDEAKRDLGSLDFAGQHQQRPGVLEGALFRRTWWRYYRETPAHFDQTVVSLDCSFKETTGGSYVVFQIWGRSAADLYLLGQVRARLDFPKTLAAFRWIVHAAPGISAKFVEDKANGPAVIATLRQEIPGIVPIAAEVSKEARWAAASPFVEAGNIHLPDVVLAERWAARLREKARESGSWLPMHDVTDDWVAGFVDELAGVPTAPFDDQADAATQVILKLLVGRMPTRDLNPKNWAKVKIA